MSTEPAPPPPAVNRRRLRWLVPPAVAFVLVAGFGFAPSLVGSSAGAAPILPDISAQDLIAKVIAADAPAFSGTVQTRTNLGLPSIGALSSGGSDLLSTLLSPQTLKVAAAPGGKFHVAIPNGLTETDVISDGTQVWLWQSSSQTVTHLARQADANEPARGTKDPTDAAEPTPDALAKRLLDNLDPTTRVFVRGTASVAGHDAYELVLSPTSSSTLVADVVIDVDAASSLPLRVQVLAKNAGTPALDVGFTSITPGAPADSTFTFTPPPGSRVVEAASPQELLFGPDRPVTRQVVPSGGPGARGGPGGKLVLPPGAIPPPAPNPDLRTQVVGDGWESVLVLPNGARGLGLAGTPVSGAWGSGRLVTSTLADALVLDDGTTLVGMVGPDRLEAAVGQIHR